MQSRIVSSLRVLVRWLKSHKILIAKLVFLALLITPIIIVTRTWLIPNADKRPAALPGGFTIESQTEPHTCGVHAVSTVYKAYGLDPEAERIRRRMGADVKAVFYLPDTTGTLHPDMWMVMVQDYFSIETLDHHDDQGWAELVDHLEAGHPAMLLIRRRENGNLHWVVATRMIPHHKIEVYDPLFDEPYGEPPSFLSEHVVTAALVRPTGDGRMAMSSVDAHLAGMAALEAALKRIDAIEKYQVKDKQ